MKAFHISRKRASSEPGAPVIERKPLASCEVSTSGTRSTAVKISVQSVLNDEFLPPYGLADFYAFLQKEHSEENIEFYQDIQRYRQRALPIFNALKQRNASRANLRPSMDELRKSRASLRRSVDSVHTSKAAERTLVNTPTEETTPNPTAESSDSIVAPAPLVAKDKEPSLPDLKPILASLREDLETLIKTYMTEGADKEINLPQSIHRRILVEIRDKHNYHPDLFKGALENVTTMMRLSSFPNFIKAASAAGGEGPVSKMKETPEEDGDYTTAKTSKHGLGGDRLGSSVAPKRAIVT
ncbi:uncharacterized protein SPPG_05196 [Spizellomyces punctatus DAOM BR117]|uniref:RGS domain-containing protein n=1 Tax=Spizellomyces punctatus (strain DAOM BR117) TaxID=645134 RepID=A0A0L0HFB6_SPIPD|nr:uncharacterized protein SPPG_05196 [Spizellomyces punctatus DAOM BR117]KNC99822.1 hypothetical protein SPPG_05196 [Spizellomyces punctatus DAOM BR117]|eukprot:XP_016607862.1 hypothetical protein SPPG_05196 [Spizellomyces punctatus DAOM BR117]